MDVEKISESFFHCFFTLDVQMLYCKPSSRLRLFVRHLRNQTSLQSQHKKNIKPSNLRLFSKLGVQTTTLYTNITLINSPALVFQLRCKTRTIKIFSNYFKILKVNCINSFSRSGGNNQLELDSSLSLSLNYSIQCTDRENSVFL